jgi:hypothetical protein
MSISSIAGTAGNAALQWLESLTDNNNAVGSNTSAPRVSNSVLNGSANLSQAGQFFAKLDSLAQSSPAQFKQLTAQISSELTTAAQQTTGQAQQFLQNLANNFQTASQTGSAASIQPPQQASGTQTQGTSEHHHHHHGGGGGYSTQSSDTSNLLSALTGTSSSSSSTTAASSSSGASSIQSVFQNIYQQVMAA